MKECCRCHERKALADFPYDTQNRDGRKEACRACVLRRQRELRAAHPEKEREWVRRNYARVLGQKRDYRRRNAEKLRVESRERARRKRSTPEGAARLAELVRQSYRRHPDTRLRRDRERAKREPHKIKARMAVKNAVLRGRIIKPRACSGCGREAQLHGHHTDYSKPLDVTWLCPKCHKRAHATG